MKLIPILLFLISMQAGALSLKEAGSPWGVWGRDPRVMQYLGYRATYFEDMFDDGPIGSQPIPGVIRGKQTSHSGKSFLTLNLAIDSLYSMLYNLRVRLTLSYKSLLNSKL